MSTQYKPTIGVEVHAELQTKSKMFCGCKNDPHFEIANHYVCPVCTAQPGSLPVVNKEAVKLVRMVGAAINGELADYSEFDRKNYFYPDIPKAYQISQYAHPLVAGGELAGVAITRIHLEEDTARSQHDRVEGSTVDFNRAGVPLMELVTEPVLHDAKAVADFAKELQLLLRLLGASEANMERGEMRVEANISISSSDELGTKVEVKNLNSFRSVEEAVRYEIARQTEVLELGESVKQETRGWDENRERTFTQRSKETAHDYRYFPDPDIVKFSFEKTPDLNKSRIKEILPKDQFSLRNEWGNFNVAPESVEVLLANQEIRTIFIEVLGKTENADFVQLISNYLTSDVLSLIAKSEGETVSSDAAVQISELLELTFNKKINSRVTKDLLPRALFEDAFSAAAVAESEGLLQLSDPESLLPLIKNVLEDNTEAVAEYKEGKEAAVKFLVGQIMKASKGTANPALAQELLLSELDS